MRKIEKRKIDKKLILMCFALMLGVFLLPGTVFAAGTEQEAEYIYGVDIPGSGEPGTIGNSRILADCAGGPHDLLAHGWGSIYNVDTNEYVVKLGACSQCTKCNLVVVTQGEPGTGNPLGYYTSWQPNEPVPTGLVTINQTTKNIQYTSGTTIPGAKFRY